MRRAFLAISALLLVAATPICAIPQGGLGPGFGDLVDPPALARYLELTEEQVASALELHAATREASQPILEENRDLETQLKELLDGDSPSPAAVGEIVITVHENRKTLKAIQQQFEEDFMALLDAEQLVRYENLKEALQVVRWSLAHNGPPPVPPEGGQPPAGS
jgi:hypothetical protein